MFKQFLVLIVGFLWVVKAQAQIIVFPFEDLSKDINGVDVIVSEKVAEAIENLGAQVIHPTKVIDFLAENRIRWVGWVDRVTAHKAAERFGADLILLGTVTEFQENPPSLGISLRLIRVPGYQVIWSRTVAISGKEEVSLFDIRPLKIEKAMNKAVTALVSRIPDEIGRNIFSKPEIEISDVFINHKRVRGNEEVECAVHIELSGPFPSELFFVWNGHKIAAVRQDHVYVARWRAPEKEGRYAVEFVARWPALSLERKFFLTNLIVDNTSPRVTLLAVKGKETSKGIAFKQDVFLVPSLERPEPIARWVFEIVSENSNQIVVHEENLGDLPLRFVWRGIDANGQPLPNGRYQARLKVWDFAGNTALAKREILLVKTPPQVDLYAKRWAGKIYLDFKIGSHPLPISFWHLEVWSKDGDLIGQFEGEGNPRTITIPDMRGLLYSLEVCDDLGNRFIVHSKKIEPSIWQAAKKKKEEREEGWVEDF